MFSAATIIGLANLSVTLGIIAVLYRQRHRLFNGKHDPEDEVTPRQYERLTQRLDGFERTLSEGDRRTYARLDIFESHMKQRLSEDKDFRLGWLDVGEKQLHRMSQIESKFDIFIRQVDFLRTTIKKAKCVQAADIAEEDCALEILRKGIQDESAMYEDELVVLPLEKKKKETDE